MAKKSANDAKVTNKPEPKRADLENAHGDPHRKFNVKKLDKATRVPDNSSGQGTDFGNPPNAPIRVPKKGGMGGGR